MKPGLKINVRRHKPSEAERIEVEHTETGELLAWCFIGDDENVERIADILSMKRLPEAAMQVRRLAVEARRPLGRRGQPGLAKPVGAIIRA